MLKLSYFYKKCAHSSSCIGVCEVILIFNAKSGFKAKPVLFTFIIPSEPKYNGKPYIGERIISFKINSTGWCTSLKMISSNYIFSNSFSIIIINKFN